jgi:hypothetical protein
MSISKPIEELTLGELKSKNQENLVLVYLVENQILKERHVMPLEFKIGVDKYSILRIGLNLKSFESGQEKSLKDFCRFSQTSKQKILNDFANGRSYKFWAKEIANKKIELTLFLDSMENVFLRDVPTEVISVFLDIQNRWHDWKGN